MAKKNKKSLALPANLKFRKPSKHLSNLSPHHLVFRTTVPNFGTYLIQSIKACFMTKGQIEATRIALRRPIKAYPKSRLWVRIKPTVVVTKRALETRMGRGKGNPVNQVALISPGQILFEIIGPPVYKMRAIYEKAKKKIASPTILKIC